MDLPPLPAPIDQFLQYTKKCSSRTELHEAVNPYKAYESKLREIYAQHPDDPAVSKNHLVPLFKSDSPQPTVRARDLENESLEVKDQYLLTLNDDARRVDGTPATVKSLSEFKTNFNLFCESSLVDLDWSNVIAAGSSVVTALLPVDAPHNNSKRALRGYYHQTLAPASDVDLFLYGLNEEQAIEKIKQIETKIRDSILSETSVIRTKNAITVVSEYPTRHVQIVLRLYKSMSEILTGFDVDCSCLAYDGSQVWASPRALTAFMTQVNTIDLTRRSPSYENRLSKYSHRGFEVHWPTLDRSRVDPTIFERSFTRVMGLARLLVLEKLPHPNDRDTYLAKRREERGRPPLSWNARFRHQLPGNVKDAQPDDVAEWVEESETSSYTTFVVPYGPKYNAKKIEKLLFTKDLLLNAEWNKPKDRETVLHRHPAFFGTAEDVIHDCCGFCPMAETDEDFAAQEEEDKIYISGEITFEKDNPGRQAIGSFHPITDDDWTEMAYIGNVTRLCQAIVDKDLEAVQDWFSSGDPEEILDVNQRDHTGRTPLLLATMASTPEIVQALIEHGARLVSRLYNGLTALHIAAYRGDLEMVKMILDKSTANEEEEARKEDTRKAARRAAPQKNGESPEHDVMNAPSQEEFEKDSEDFSDDESSDDVTEGSFVKVSDKDKDNTPEDNEDDPDVYDIDVLAWDQPMSPLHLAIIAGRIEVIKTLINQYGADVLLPVKILGQQSSREPEAAVLTLILALEAPLNTARTTIDTLLSYGALTTQADMKERSAIHFAVNEAKTVVLEAMQAGTESSALAKAINHVSINGRSWYNQQVEAPLLTAICTRDTQIVDKVLGMGACVEIDYETYAKAYSRNEKHAARRNTDDIRKEFRKSVEQPVILATKMEMPAIALRLLEKGSSANTLPKGAWEWLEGRTWNNENKSLLDLVRDRIKSLEESVAEKPTTIPEKPEPLAGDDEYLDYPKGSYRHWVAVHDVHQAKIVKRRQMKDFESEMERLNQPEEDGHQEKKQEIKKLITLFRKLEEKITTNGGKTFYELHPDAEKPQEGHRYSHNNTDTTVDKGPYKTTFSFNDVTMTDDKKQAYIALFEAAWTGDAETVKRLCIETQDPLHVATQDLAGFSPFTIAVTRGHEQLAATILEIAIVQYLPPKDEPKYRYRLGNADIDDDYDSDNSSTQDEDGPRVLKELVDDKFTVEDITTLADNVKSKVSPVSILDNTAGVWRAFGGSLDHAMEAFDLSNDGTSYSVYFYGQNFSDRSWPWFHRALPQERSRCNQSIIRYAIVQKDMKLLRFLLKMGQDLMGRKDADEASNVYKIREDDFTHAIKLGRIEMLGEIIKFTGQAMPLDKMMETSGVKLDEKPKYYQGLSVYGKKRQDWAERGQGRQAPVEANDEAPMLKAIFQGSLPSAEYYVSDGPLNRYEEFAKTHQDDKRIKGLAASDSGIDKTLSSWLSTRSDLCLHMAVMANPPEKDNPLLQYVLKTMPNGINAKSSSGLTALHVAFTLGRVEAARILIAAGADQTTRDDEGANILHTIFKENALVDPQILPSVLGLLDPKLLQHLLLEKSSKPEPGSMTPLATYINHFAHDRNVIPVLRIILEHSADKDLEILNGAGDYLLHDMVRSGRNELVLFLVERRPEMLYWENATGLTPIDVAQIASLRDVIENPPDLNMSEHYSTAEQQPGTFAKKHLTEDKKKIQYIMDLDEEDLKNSRGSQWYMYRLLQRLAGKYPGKRKLVSLFDANQVAKRLAREQQKRNAESRRQERMGLNSTGMRDRERFDDSDENRRRTRGDREDEVSRWMGTARGFPQADLLRLEKEIKAKDEAGK